MLQPFRGDPGLAALLTDPGHLLHRLDRDADSATFLPVVAARLRQAGFLDGRTPLSEAVPVVAAGLAAAAGASRPAGQARYIFHGAFCGSTLLGRLLDHPGRALVLREPDVLANIADLALGPITKAELQRLCVLASASLFHPRTAGAPVVVKPSNWVNNILPELCAAAGEARAVIIESDLPDFLIAVFRGGSDRMRFVAQCAWRLSRADPADDALLARAARDGATPAAKAAHLAVVLHAFQRRRFMQVRADPRWARVQMVRQADLFGDPLSAARLSAAALQLDLPDEALAAAVGTWAGRHAKDAAVDFTAEAGAAADRAVDKRFGGELRSALAWAEGAGLAG